MKYLLLVIFAVTVCRHGAVVTYPVVAGRCYDRLPWSCHYVPHKFVFLQKHEVLVMMKLSLSVVSKHEVLNEAVIMHETIPRSCIVHFIEACIEVLVDEVVVMHPRSMKHSLLVVAVTICHGAVIMYPRSIVCLYCSSMKYSLLNRMKLWLCLSEKHEALVF